MWQARRTDAAGVPLLPPRMASEAAAMKSLHTPDLEPWQIRELQDDKRRGMTPDALADKYRVSRRTVYRFLAGRVERVYVDGWSAFFFLSGKRAPQRLTTWDAP
jgi:hypothetical protein